MNASLGVDLGFVGAWNVGELSALQDVEVIVGGMATAVSLGTDSSAYCVLN